MIGDAIEWIAKSISRGLLAMSVLCGPAFWILSFWFAYLLWRPGISSEMFLSSAYLTFLFAFWAAWGLIGGPMHIRPWWLRWPRRSTHSLASAFSPVSHLLNAG